ncbi:MAG: RNA polymerase sigma factor [Actinomycetota bacterium]|nr:RNA polymerase sigma factor [Actinomycetota bacterium]
MDRSRAAADAVEEVFRAEHGRVLATLVRFFGDIDVAEEALQDAMARAVERWPADGVPPNPAGWIVTTARNRGIDRIRRENRRDDRYQQAHRLDARDAPEVGPVDDDQLRLMFTCCHPALAPHARIALTLKLIGGLATGEIARAFLVPEPTMFQRITRAKNKIRDAAIPYRIPEDHELPDRLSGVLTVLYLIFNEGYAATTGEALVRRDLSDEAIRLARVLDGLMPDEAEVQGLLGLFLLTDARRAARLDADGHLVRLADQDRTRWDRDRIEEGHRIVRRCLRRDQPGPFQVQAAIAAVHADAPTAADTDWSQIVALYDLLLRFTPSPVVRLNRAIAVAELDGPEAALPQVEALDLVDNHLWWAALGDLHERLGNRAEAADALERAASLATNDAERTHLERRRAAIR